MNDPINPNLGFAHYWAQGDAITHSVAYLLLLMSIVSWYYILSKTWTSWRIRQSAGALERFWDAPNLEDAITLLNHEDTEHVYSPLATHAAEAVSIKSTGQSLNASVDLGELGEHVEERVASAGVGRRGTGQRAAILQLGRNAKRQRVVERHFEDLRVDENLAAQDVELAQRLLNVGDHLRRPPAVAF